MQDSTVALRQQYGNTRLAHLPAHSLAKAILWDPHHQLVLQHLLLELIWPGDPASASCLLRRRRSCTSLLHTRCSITSAVEFALTQLTVTFCYVLSEMMNTRCCLTVAHCFYQRSCVLFPPERHWQQNHKLCKTCCARADASECLPPAICLLRVKSLFCSALCTDDVHTPHEPLTKLITPAFTKDSYIFPGATINAVQNVASGS